MTKKRVKVELEEEIWHQTRARSIQNGVAAGIIVEDALRQYLTGSPAERAREQIEESVAREAKIPMAAATAPVELEALPDDLDEPIESLGTFGESHAAPKPEPRAKRVGGRV
jgi:hypothetical protein